MPRFQILLVVAFLLLLLLLADQSSAEGSTKIQRISEIFEFHLISLTIDSPPIPASHVASCCLEGSWLPPDTCAVRCRIFLRVCLTSKNGTYQALPSSCMNATSQTMSTPVVFLNNTLFNSSLDFRLDLHRNSQRPYILQTSVNHRSQTGDEVLLIDLPPIEVDPIPRGVWSTRKLGPKAELEVMTLSYRFICPPNYYGVACERFCAARDSVLGHYRCDPNDGRSICLPGWKGNQCTEAICETGCLHGSCISPGVCKCHEGWKGDDCNQCIPIPGCQHGGCKSNWTLGHAEPFTCACKPGWSGMFCSIDTKFCSNHPGTCKNGGVCHSTPSETGASPGYACQCQVGYQGYHCENKNNDCRGHGCHGNGICQNTGKCVCFDNYYGSNCQFNQTQCSEHPCQGKGSVCKTTAIRVIENEIKVEFHCLCQTGLTGTNCEEKIKLCDTKPCKHGGKCVDHVAGYQCVCLPGYKGHHCDLHDSACQHLPCANGGECVDRANRVECHCPPGWTGLTCRENVNECASLSGTPVCKNGAACRDRPGSYECLCTAGWQGRDCSIASSSLSVNVTTTTMPLLPTTTTQEPDVPCLDNDLTSTKCNVVQNGSSLVGIWNKSNIIRCVVIISIILLILFLVIILLVLLLRQRSRLRFGVSRQLGQSNKGLSKEGFEDMQQHHQKMSIKKSPAPKCNVNKCPQSVYWTDPHEMFICGFDPNSSQPRLIQLKEGPSASSSSSTSNAISSSKEKQRNEYFTQVIATSPLHVYPSHMHPQFHPLRSSDLKHAVVYTCQTPPPPYEDLVQPRPPHKPSYL